MPFILVYVTHPNQETAEKIASILLEKRLVACANFFPITSAYWWQGKIDTTEEVVTLLKTRKENWQVLQEEVRKLHPYETPCIMKMETSANEDYEKWIYSETKDFSS